MNSATINSAFLIISDRVFGLKFTRFWMKDYKRNESIYNLLEMLIIKVKVRGMIGKMYLRYFSQLSGPLHRVMEYQKLRALQLAFFLYNIFIFTSIDWLKQVCLNEQYT
jgi:hypothetical protein